MLRHFGQNIGVGGVALEGHGAVAQGLGALLSSGQPGQPVGIHIKEDQLIENPVFVADKLAVVALEIVQVAQAGGPIALQILLGLPEQLPVAADRQQQDGEQQHHAQRQTADSPVEAREGL